MGDWSQLPQELVTEIAKELLILEDFAAFSTVCTSWRSALFDQYSDLLDFIFFFQTVNLSP